MFCHRSAEPAKVKETFLKNSRRVVFFGDFKAERDHLFIFWLAMC